MTGTQQEGWSVPPASPRPTLDPNVFMAASPRAMNGSSPWAVRYAETLKRVVYDQAMYAPRSQQRHLGPSEIGAECDRQVVGKLAGIPATNNVIDPWPSVVGTAVHAWFDKAFSDDNSRRGQARWLPERRVIAHPDHPGTADLYDGFEQAVVDHKVLGPTTHAKLKAKGPSRRYRVQLHTYGKGYRNLGLPVKRVVLAAWPRTESTLDNLYVWEEATSTAESDALLAEVFQQMVFRKALAGLITSGKARLTDIPAVPDDTECYFCPFYRPQAAKDSGIGCPGTIGHRPQ